MVTRPQEPEEATVHHENCHVGPLTIGQIWRVVRSGMWLEPGTRFSVDGGSEHALQEITQVVTERLRELQATPSKSTKTPIKFCDVVGKGKTNIADFTVPDLESVLAALKSLSSPWRRLPPELLVEIFAWCIPPHDILSTSSAPLLLTRICSRWHNLSVNNPSLWTSIILAENFFIHQVHLRSATNFEGKWGGIRCADFDVKEADFIFKILDRSRTLPLSLSTHPGLFSCPHAGCLLREILPRSKHLALLFPEPASPHRPPIPPTPIPLAAPLLESLDLYAPPVRGLLQEDPHWVLPFISLIQSSLRTLRRLNVITGTPIWPFTDTGASWDLITHITWMPVILTSDVFDFFRTAPNLVYACFPNILDDFIKPPPPEPVSLPCLEVLITKAEGLFDSITLPRLQHLVLLKSSDREKDALISFFRRSACLLETLYLYEASYNEARSLLEILDNVEGGVSSSDQRMTIAERGHLKALLIADNREEYSLFSDNFMAKLTWTPGSRQDDRILFPGLEYLSLYNIGQSATAKLAALLSSRSLDLRSTIEGTGRTHISTYPMKLKVFESWHPDANLNILDPMDWAAIEELRKEGLVLRTFKTSDSRSCITNADKAVLKRYVEEKGLVVRDYLHDIGQFAPILLQEELDTYKD
jgi:hypothetical protein